MIAKRMTDGTALHHIRNFKAEFETGGAKLDAVLTRDEVVKMIRSGTEHFYVIGDDDSQAKCEVVEDKPPYVKSTPDKSKRDNLLSLPNF